MNESTDQPTPPYGPLEPLLGPLDPVLGALTPPPGGPPGVLPPPGNQFQVPARESGVSNTIGNLALVSAILGFCCIPFAGGVIGIVMGRIGMDRAKRGLATNGGVAQAGFWLGVVGVGLSVLGFVVTIILSVINSPSGA